MHKTHNKKKIKHRIAITENLRFFCIDYFSVGNKHHFMGHKKQKPKKKVSTRHVQKRTRAKKAKHHHPKKSTARTKRIHTRISAKHRSRKIKRPAIKSRRRSDRRIGYATRVKVTDSKFFKKEIKIKRRETRLAKKERIKLNSKTKKSVTNLLGAIVHDQYEALGKSKDNLYYMRIRYRCKVNGKYETRYFSTPTAKLKSTDNLDAYLEIQLSEFLSRQQSYASRGVANIQIDGVMISGYEGK